MGSWGCAVDFVSKYHISKNRAGTELKFTVFGIIIVYSRDIAWHHIRGKLDPAETAAGCLCKGAEEHRLSCAGYIFQQNVSAA